MSIPMDFQLALLGGLLIGAASVLLMFTHGRISGISGITASVMQRLSFDELRWRWAFLAGLIGVGAIMAPEVNVPAAGNHLLLVVAGLLVGFGTRLGSGCTSGHGVCGLGRRSLRSLVAVMVFMFAGFVTVYLLRHGGF